MYAWGASDGVRPDEAVDAFPALLPHLLDEAVRKWAGQARGVPARGGCPSGLKAVRLQGVPARNTPDAHLSAA
jgi:hypothetical protein